MADKFKLTDLQISIIQRLVRWYYLDSYHKQLFVIGGVAGSSKSTIVKYAIKALELTNSEVLFATYIAKAALRLRMLGNNANTIHSTFYSIYRNEITGEIAFYKKRKIEDRIKCIVIDEAAMVPDYMIKDILTFRVPTILLGDNCQLPPLMHKNTFMETNNLDVFLSESLRFDDTSGILTLATLSREKQHLRYGQYNKSNVVHFKSIRNEIHKYDVVLCYKNSTRMDLNAKIRNKLGYGRSLYPKKGEKIVCLHNNYNHKITYMGIDIYLINGLVGIMLEDAEIDQKTGKLRLKFIPDFMLDSNSKEYFDVLAHPEYFEYIYDRNIRLPLPFEMRLDGQKRDIQKEEENRKYAFITFGYAITVHKSQGSEFDNVLIISDDHPMNHMHYFKYLYTGITRAKKSVTVATFK